MNIKFLAPALTILLNEKTLSISEAIALAESHIKATKDVDNVTSDGDNDSGEVIFSRGDAVYSARIRASSNNQWDVEVVEIEAEDADIEELSLSSRESSILLAALRCYQNELEGVHLEVTAYNDVATDAGFYNLPNSEDMKALINKFGAED